MGSVLGSIFGFGNKMKRRLRDAVSNPSDYAEMTADENRNEWRKNPDERSLGFFNPVPLGTMGNFTMRKELGDAVANLSRRDFLKKSAGLAGGTAAASIPGAKLLQKFAPEERAIAKEAVTEATPKYKYNSLKEYLDDVTDYSHDIGHERAYESAMEHGYNNHPEADRYMDDFVDNFDFSKIQKERLLRDEEAYNTAKFFYKDNLKDPTTGKWIDPFTGKPHSEEFLRNIRNTIEDFSPQAKKEMNLWKNLHGDDWHSTDIHKWEQFKDPDGGFIHSNDGNYKIFSEDAIKRWGATHLEANKIYPQIYTNSGHQQEIVNTGLWKHTGFNTRQEVDNHMKTFFEVASKKYK